MPHTRGAVKTTVQSREETMYKGAQSATDKKNAAENAMLAGIAGKGHKAKPTNKPQGPTIDHLVKPCGSLAALEKVLDQACAMLGLTPEDAVELSATMPMGSPIDAVLVAA